MSHFQLTTELLQLLLSDNYLPGTFVTRPHKTNMDNAPKKDKSPLTLTTSKQEPSFSLTLCAMAAPQKSWPSWSRSTLSLLRS